jgi:hypothetical protein
MRLLSERFLGALLACLALGALAAWVLLLRGGRWETCRYPEEIRRAPTFAGAYTAVPPEKKDGVFEITERKTTDPASRTPVHLVVARSDRPFSLFGNWFLKIRPPIDAVEMSSIALEVDGETVPVQGVRTTSDGVTHLAVALFVSDGRPIDSAFGPQLNKLGQQLIRGTLPLTMYAADGWAPVGQEDAIAKSLQAWLADAWKHHRRVCGP